MKNDPLKELLKRDGYIMPDNGFKARLKHMVVTQYKLSYGLKYRKEERLGKVIAVFLILTAVAVLIQLDLSWQALPLILPFLLLGVGVILLMRKMSAFVGADHI